MILLREKREQRGLSQFQLAAASGVPQQTISAIEMGIRKNPGVETILPLARALGLGLEDLVSMDEPEPKQMTIQEFAALPKTWVGTREVSALLQTDRYGLNLAAKAGKLGFDFFFSGNRLKISKASVLKFCGYDPEAGGVTGEVEGKEKAATA